MQVQRVRGFALVAIGVLGRAIQGELAVFFGHRVGDLAFEVKLFLLPGAGGALDLVGRAGNGCRRIAAHNAFGRHHKALRFQRLFHGQDRLEFLDQHLGFGGGFAGVDHLASHHHGHSLPHKLDLAVGQERVVVHDGAAVVLAGDVARSEYRHHTVLFQNGVAVNAVAQQFTVRHRRLDERCIQSTGHFRNVVNVGGCASDVQVGRLMDDVGALLHTRGGQQVFQVDGRVHSGHLFLFFNEFKHQVAGHQ